MSWQDDIMIEQEQADALNYMGEAEWRDLYREERKEKECQEKKSTQQSS